MAAFGDILYPFEQFLIVIGTKTDDFDYQPTTDSEVKIWETCRFSAQKGIKCPFRSITQEM